MRPLWMAMGALAVLLSSCTNGSLRDGVFSKHGVRYRVGEVPPGWKRLHLAENDLAFVAEGSAHSIAANSTCEDFEDAPLPVLVQHLLMGFTEKEKVSESLEPLNGRESLRTHYVAKLDGVPVELLLVVLKKDGCIYDLTYLSPVGRFDEKLSTFEELVAHFSTEPDR